MSNLQVNKVDLSLDDIIKLNKKQRQPQVQNRRGNGRIQGRAGSRSRGVRGRNSPGSTSSSGTSQLNRKRAGSGSTRGVIRGQLARRRNLRGKVGYRGSVQRGGSVSSQGEIVSQNAATNQKNTSGGFYFRGIRRYRGENCHPAIEVACVAGFDPADIESKLDGMQDKFRQKQLQSHHRNTAAQKIVLDRRYDRERLLCESDDLLIIYDCQRQLMIDWFIRKDKKRPLTHFEEDAQNCVKAWSPVNREKYQSLCSMLSRNTAILAAAIRHVLGRRGGLQGRGGSAVSQGILQRGVQRRSQGSLNRMSLKQKRQMAIQTLRQARRTIVQLDQQTARQNFVNANRGIIQQNQRLLAKKNRGMYSSSVSLASVSSHNSSASSGRRLQGTRITAFSPSRSQQSLGGQQRMRSMSQSPVGSLNANTLTISIDNTSPGRTDLNAYQVNASVTRQRQKRRQWRRQKSNSSFDSLDLSIGATPSFSHQLSKLKPTVSTTYVFQKRVFSSGSTQPNSVLEEEAVECAQEERESGHPNMTSFSLNDRFSASAAEDKAGRKVFL